MNLFTYRNVVTGRIFALLAAVSMILSTVPVSFLIAEASVQTVPFSDDFESGLGNWFLVNVPWTIESTVGAHSGTSYAEASATSSTEIMILSLDTTGYENLSLSFWYQMDFTSTNPISGFSVLESTDGLAYAGVPSGVLGAADKSPSTWVQKVVPLSATLNNIASASLWLQFNNSYLPGYVRIDDVEITGTPIATSSCTPQYSVVGPTDVQNTDTSEYFNSIQDAINDCDTVNGNTIVLSADVTTSAQVTIDKEIILDGGGNTLFSNFAKTTNSNNSAIGVQANNATIKNLTIDGSGGTNLHGVNVYQSTGILLDALSFTNINRSAVVVNASEVTVNNISTSNSGTEGPTWKVIDVDPKNTTASLIVNGVSTHDEALPRAHIWAQNPTNVTITDTNNQYDMMSFPIFGGDRYRLRTPEPVATIVATKIVCEDESMLPNWGNGSADITATTATDFVAHNPGCHLTEGWNFQWAPQTTFDAGDTLIGEAGAPWTTFGPTDSNGVATVSLNANQIGGSNYLWFREVLQNGYIPFTHDQNGNTNADDVSAEVYCASDVLNYDNFDRIDGITLNETYYCVAFNAEVPTYTIDGYKWNDTNGDGQWDDNSEHGITDWKIALRPMNMLPTEEVFVPADESVVTTATSLIAGHTYIVEASGTYSFGNRPDFIADAEWTHRTDGFQDSPLLPHGWTLGENTYPSVVGLDLQINNQNIDWGAFNNDHLYKTMIEGDGTPLDFFIYDSYYGDNTGGLNVAIYDVTDYVTSTDSSGYYSFEVPEGEYQIVEEMVDGWTQTYPAGPSYYHVTVPDMYTVNYDFGNQQVEIPHGEIIIQKVIIGSNATADQFSFSINDGSPVTFEADGSNTVVLTEGLYTIRELPQTDYDVTYEGCDDIVVQASANTVPVCTITNTYHPPLACVADVNLLANPSFEDPIVTATQKWDNLPAVGWIAKAVSNNAIVGMELQRGVFGWLPSDGEQITELDTDQNVRIKQVINTIPGETYTLLWDYSARPGTSAPDSKMIVRVNGHKIATNNEDGSTYSNTNWISNSYSFVASSTHTKVAFIGRGSSNSLGALLDNTSLTCVPAEPEIPYGPYCGDGALNQEWEQCEVGDEGCTDYCIFENQCTDLQLVKITLNESESVSFDNKVYLGSATNPIPSGAWFNFNELGDNSINNIATQDNGLAVSRDTTNKQLILGFRGQNDQNELDYAIGSIDTLGSILGSVDRSPIIGWPLENGSGGSFFDVFQKNGTNTSVQFDLRADTGRDAVSVKINTGETYNCPLTQQIGGYKWNDLDGNGVRSSDEPYLSGWTIEATFGTTTLSTTTDNDGMYSFDLPAGHWTISEVQQAGWQQTGLVLNGDPVTSGETTCSIDTNPHITGNQMSQTPQCNFGNQEITTIPDNTLLTEHHYGGRVSRGPVGQVLGASISNQCPFLLDFMQMGVKNDPWEVTKLQAFLDEFVAPTPITGFFGIITDRNVKKFQMQYKDEILNPWFEKGIVGNTNPTGFVYKTTLWKINDIICPDYAVLPNFEGEDLTHDVDLD